jgi:uncharacterized membrane protein HdeD (DUF308 family)
MLMGRQDQACSVDHAITLNRMIDGPKIVILEEARSFIQFEQPKAFNRTVLEFIDTVENTLKGINMTENNSQLSVAQLQEIRAAVLGAAARAPGALIGLGILFIVLGMIGVAGQVMFSFVTINVLGAFLIIGGGLQFAHAIKSHGWKSVGIQIVLAVLYIVAGLFTWAFPIPALEGITLWLAAIFFVTGLLRLVSAFQHRHFGEWFWLVLSSAISILMGVLIMNGYPASSLWLPGLLIAIELLLQGWSMLFLGLAARKLIQNK